MKRKVPISWSILRERTGTCQVCGTMRQFKHWTQLAFPYPAVRCAACFIYELDMAGATKDYFREKK